MRYILLFSFCLNACSALESPTKKSAAKEFSRGEVILAHQLLTKVFDQEMAPVSCVADTDEAALLLRTLAQRMEQVQDDLEAMLDDNGEVKKLIETCDQNCTCGFVDDLLREHQVELDKALTRQLELKKKQKDLNSCLNYVQETFCSGELFETLTNEKAQFAYEVED